MDSTSLVVVLVAVVGVSIGIVVGAVAVQRSRPDPDAGIQSPHPEIDRLVDVLEGLTTGVVLCDEHGVITFRNQAARSFAGTLAGVLIDEKVERHLGEAVSDGPSEELVELYGRPKLVAIVRAVPVASGGACAFIDDISERRRIDAVRTDFVANISHELKTPVGALAVLAETIIDEPDREVIGRIADRMLDEAHRAAQTIDDLLELSRIELGGELECDDVSSADIVHRAVERVQALAEQRRIPISVLHVDPVLVNGDRRQLISAVGNLVENAVKYSEPPGGVDVLVRSDGGWVEFVVADQGVGIPTRDLDRVFERFYRVDKARSRGTGGSGLGLSIVRHVATNHGGEVVVSSTEGEGSTFVLRVPVPLQAGGAAPRSFCARTSDPVTSRQGAP